MDDINIPDSHRSDEENRADEVVKRPSSEGARSKRRVPSALTVENLRKHEEETDAIDVVELMTKNGRKDPALDGETELGVSHITQDKPIDEITASKTPPPYGAAEEDVEEPLDYPSPDRSATPIEKKIGKKQNEATELLSDIWSQPRKQTVEPIVSPAMREEIRGVRFTGEEYVAISIEVQTEESFLAETYQLEGPWNHFDHDFSHFHSKPVSANAAADSTTRQQNADEDSTLHVTQSGMSDDFSRKRDNSVGIESDTADENIVNDITESELDGSEAATHLTHETTQTIPSVGPPFILQYKAESQMVQLDYADVDVAIPEDIQWDDMSPEQRDYYKTIMEDMKQLTIDKHASLMQGKELISIEPHSAYGSQHDRKLAKERERERSRMREMKKQSKQAATGGQMMANQTNFYAFARQLKTVNYSLSSEKCMEEGWTIRPVTPPTPDEPAAEIFVYDPNQDIVSGKKFQHMFVKKLYPNGSMFLAIFPDGTGNVWYPSGNLAFSIIATEKIGKMTFIVHEDVHPSEGHNIQAIFEPTGCCTCYYPSGVIRSLLTPFGGEYFGPQGERLKKWIWRDTHTHVHAPPFQPITFALNKKVGVRIMSQESIYITFNDGCRSVRFNAGTRLRLKQAALLPKIHQVDADQVLLDEKRYHVQSIIERIQNNLKFPHSPRLKKIQLPNYLTSEMERNAKLRERLNEQQMLNPRKPRHGKKLPSLRNRSSTKVSLQNPNIKTFKGKIRPIPRPRKEEYQEIDEIFRPIVVVN